jgi:hypothetical protein
MRELAVEYKKYLDMGGKEKKLSDLTTDGKTVERLTGYYEELGKAAQEAAQEQEKAKKKRKGGKYSKQKGSNYELKIIHELESLGYEGLKSSRSQSKNLDNAKVDIAETVDKLPFYAQVKCTKNTPNYFKIQEECPLTDRDLVLFWNRQEVKDGQVNMSSRGEVVFVPKELFYKLLKSYKG